MNQTRLTPVGREHLKLVGMNEVEGLEFEPGSEACLATQQLNGCTAIVFFNTYAAVLGHLAPRPDGADPNAAVGDVFMAHNLQKLRNRIVQFERTFRMKPHPKSLVVYALATDEDGAWGPALDSQVKMVEQTMAKWRVSVGKISYDSLRSRDPRGSEKSEAVVDPRGEHVCVYVEDEVVFPSKA